MSTTINHDPRVRIALSAIERLKERARNEGIWPPVHNIEPRILEYLLTHAGSADRAVNASDIEEALASTQSVIQKAICHLPGSLLLAGITEIQVHRIARSRANGGNHYYVTIS